LMQPWTEWKTSFQQTAAEAFLGLLKIAGDAWRAMRQGAHATGDFIADTFSTAVDWIAQRLVDAQEKLGILSEEEAAQVRGELNAMQKEAQRQKSRERAARDQEIEKEREQADRDFGETVVDANKAIANANRAQLESSRKDLEDAKANLQGLINQANQKTPRPDMKLPDVVDLKKVAEKTSVAGTFSANAARGFGGVNPMKKVEENTRATAKAVEKQEELLAEIRDKIETRYTA